MVLAGLYCLMCRDSPQGSDVLIVANDEDQAGADLDLAKKLVGINPDLAEGTVPRIETNRSLIAELKERIVTGPQPSIRVADLLQPLEDRRSWTIWDRGGQVHDSLRLMGRMR
jgi:hypothetical protein